jgi:lipid II isoglutaminyl synthase (glutamine-hydrolysing)
MKARRNWRAEIAAGAVRLVNSLSRRLGRGSGTVAGGRVGLWLDPQLLTKLARGRRIVLVSGTNGKTTTSAMLRAGWGAEVAGNETGANMPEGHVAALSASSATRVVLETDEAWLATVLRATAPEIVVLLNLSRDQLDRASEVRQMAQRWRDCLEEGRYDGVVVANAADPMVVYAAQRARRVRWVDVPVTWRADAASCPQCTRAIVFDESWSCVCGFAQPIDVTATLRDAFYYGAERYELGLSLPGAFNDANAALALTALVELDVDLPSALGRVRSLATVQGRYGLRRYGERTVRLLLAKNPAGTAALLESLEPTDEIWVAINAQTADGKDPSWLYDVPFESLSGRHVRCLGERRLDLATRLSYVDVSNEVVDDPHPLRHGTSGVTLIANYTAFREWMGRTHPC